MRKVCWPARPESLCVIVLSALQLPPQHSGVEMLLLQSQTNAGVASPMQGRAAARENESDTPVVPITVRQLEAVVRIAESYARMQLQVKPPPDVPCACEIQRMLHNSVCPLAAACPTSTDTLLGYHTVEA